MQTKTQNLYKTRADFRIDEFRKTIQQKGIYLTWEQQAVCPCNVKDSSEYGLDIDVIDDISLNSKQNNITCPVCNGAGRIFHSPELIQAIMTKPTIAVGTSDQKNMEYGLYQDSYSNFTIEPEHFISFGDRLTLRDSLMIFKEVIERGNTLIDSTAHPIRKYNFETQTGPVELGVLYLHVADANGLTIPNEILEEGVDFEITADGNIDWTICDAAKLPDEGQRLSITYYTNPSYIVVKIPYIIRDTVNLKYDPNTNNDPKHLLTQVTAKLQFMER